MSAVFVLVEEGSRLTGETGPLMRNPNSYSALAMAIASGQEGAVHSHARRALETVATHEELRQVGLAAHSFDKTGPKCTLMLKRNAVRRISGDGGFFEQTKRNQREAHK